MTIRFGGRWLVRWPVRWLVLAGVLAAGLLPYKFEVGGHCRIVPQSEFGLRCQLQDEIDRIYVTDGQQVEEVLWWQSWLAAMSTRCWHKLRPM